mmetsp:Transcript_25319/g.74510  ORF Transcript_25319/g.74510 Transcript_25319/m.74510 type:complete len:99 (-) Transcript_25319:1627-1923(-)
MCGQGRSTTLKVPMYPLKSMVNRRTLETSVWREECPMRKILLSWGHPPLTGMPLSLCIVREAYLVASLPEAYPTVKNLWDPLALGNAWHFGECHAAKH